MIRRLGRARKAMAAIFDREGSMRAICLLRIFVGPVVILHLQPFLQDMQEGISYRDHFYAPYVSWFPEAPEPLYFGILIACVVSAALMSLGVFTRLTSSATFLLVTYNFFLSETHFRHNRNFLLIVLFGLALLPCGRVFSLDAWWKRRRGLPIDEIAPVWPIWLLRFEASTVYFASGFSKLLDRDWWGGVVTWDRVLRFRHHLDESIAPDWVKDLVTREEFHQVFGKVNVITELFVGLGLWFRPTRLAAIWMAIVFHVTIEITARVQIFSWLAIAGLLIWAVPDTRDRVLILDRSRRGARLLGSLVRWLDWLARFRVEEAPPGVGEAIRVVDRGGRIRTGGAAVRLVVSRLPLLFFPTAPFLLLDTHPRRRIGAGVDAKRTGTPGA